METIRLVPQVSDFLWIKHHPRHLFYNPQPACQTTFTYSIPCRCKNIRDFPVSLVRAYLTSFSLFSAGRIDHGHHDGKAIRALTDTVALNKAVAKAIDIVNKGNIWFNYFTVLIGLDNTTSLRSNVWLLSQSYVAVCLRKRMCQFLLAVCSCSSAYETKCENQTTRVDAIDQTQSQ